jgi:hypothetical protein
MRIGSLMSERRDIWWAVGSETDSSSLAIEVASTIEHYAIRFFSSYESNQALLAQLRKGICPGCTPPQAAVVHALLANHLGYEAEAGEAIKTALARAGVSGFSERVVTLAQKLGLSVS